MNRKDHYEFINVQTGNVIGHLSLKSLPDNAEQTKELETAKTDLATAHKLNSQSIYWQNIARPAVKKPQ